MITQSEPNQALHCQLLPEQAEISKNMLYQTGNLFAYRLAVKVCIIYLSTHSSATLLTVILKESIRLDRSAEIPDRSQLLPQLVFKARTWLEAKPRGSQGLVTFSVHHLDQNHSSIAL